MSNFTAINTMSNLAIYMAWLRFNIISKIIEMHSFTICLFFFNSEKQYRFTISLLPSCNIQNAYDQTTVISSTILDLYRRRDIAIVRRCIVSRYSVYRHSLCRVAVLSNKCTLLYFAIYR